jgi:hypothetical protein
MVFDAKRRPREAGAVSALSVRTAVSRQAAS